MKDCTLKIIKETRDGAYYDDETGKFITSTGVSKRVKDENMVQYMIDHAPNGYEVKTIECK